VLLARVHVDPRLASGDRADDARVGHADPEGRRRGRPALVRARAAAARAAAGSARAELELGAVGAEERELRRLAELDLLDPAPAPAGRAGRARRPALGTAQRQRRQQPLTTPLDRAPLHHAFTFTRARVGRNRPFRREEAGPAAAALST